MGNRQGKTKTIDEELGNQTSHTKENQNQENSVSNDKHQSSEEKNRNQDTKNEIPSKLQQATTSYQRSNTTLVPDCSSLYLDSSSQRSLPDLTQYKDSKSVQKSATEPENLHDLSHPKDKQVVQESFLDPNVRNRFIRKVFLILTVQLLCTFGITALFVYEPHVNKLVPRQRWIYWISICTFFLTLMAIACCTDLRRRYPTNLILLGVFTLAFSYLTGAMSSAYDTKIVLSALGISAGLCFLISLLSFYTRFDLRTCGGILAISLILLMIMGFVSLSVRDQTVLLMSSASIAVLLNIYLISDTQRIIGGKAVEISDDEYIYATLTLYIDVINIYLFILLLFGILANK